MSNKPKTFLQNGMHTAGIFSDLSVDGPEIGTVVAVVDRAKNLPNRKTIGKQDPYCAARLGKEAKKTTTDIRGGQTPKWDQELRFVAYDSPDYYQLKVSVFNDDKRTDLIGETWIDLRDIIVPGGGLSDLWHSLSYKGKYAGEVRMEITYYDSRPKPEKPAAKPKPVAADQQDGPKPTTTSRTPVKRRPLPSDPVTGEVAEPAAVTPVRAHPMQPSAYVSNQSPVQAAEYNTPPPGAPRQYQLEPYGHSPHAAPNPHPNSYGTPPARMDVSQPHTPTSGNRQDVYLSRAEERDYSPRHHSHTQLSYPQRDSLGFYSPRSDRYDAPPPIDNYRQELPAGDDRPPPPPVHRSRHNSSVGSQDMVVRSSFETPPKGTSPMRHDVLKHEAHRRAPSYPGRPAYRPYDSSPAAPNPMSSPPADNALTHQPSPSHRRSHENGHDAYRSMQPTVEDVPESPTPARKISQGHPWTPQRDEPTYDQHVSPAPVNTTDRGNAAPVPYSRSPQYETIQYDQSASPAPLNLSGKGNAMPPQYNTLPQSNHPSQDDYRHQQPSVSPLSQDRHRQPSVSPLSHGEYDFVSTEASHHTHNSLEQHAPQANELQGNELQLYGMPSVPPSLVPGVDPMSAQEVADRMHQERRQERRYTSQDIDTPPRGRYHPEHANYANYAREGSHGSPQTYTSQSYDDRSVMTYSNVAPAQNYQLVKASSVSPQPMPNPMPNPQHTIKRKSVSPAPPPRDDPSEGRRLSGVPFGPDSYDALNPVLSSGKDANEPDSNGKIITHDGREIDPSDHLPMETWAPEPEPRPAKAPTPETRPRPNGAQPMPPSGRRPLRVAGRPHSQSAAALPPPSYGLSDGSSAVAPLSGNRNRLQKKAQRVSALPAPPAADSGPLAPISSHNYQEGPGNGFTPPQRLPRASTWDYPSENRAPQYGSSPGSRAMTGPPLPAKVPLPVMSGALVRSGGEPTGEDWALMQEMSRIDIGTGRSRRHGGY
ncbi:hypothetical protein SODALDRAFT_118655 [Sodiomyces alkalinus F11]|uniref:C2 domain-containing protein n=1 Tax=Sodiomyces alkalinus (strain CBS 110278 / VKM F-3762 / F11) TaxID=1314773 RepID=A0A3N2Q3R9_SODAK|nr:hypothetical protein SODALDRAFT_118655 [Sodiomyces alkalinus F11]ROT41403.1 hypothetical protein SODALDRAFT_118655 [Sodiomyces alkalinus F11]